MSHVSAVVYEGKCNCCENYIGETRQNVNIRWDEHSDVGKNSGPAKYFYQFSEPQVWLENSLKSSK